MGSKTGDTVERLKALALAPGVFVYDMRKQLVFADELLANAFGLDADLVRHGIGADVFWAVIHPDDRSRVRAASHAPSEGFFALSYRIRPPDRPEVAVRCVGYTFFDNNGPVKRAGSLRVLNNDPIPRRDTMFDLCHTVGQLADEEGDPMVRYAMDVVLQHLSERE